MLSTHEPEHAFIVADQVAILGRDRFATGTPMTTMTSDELSRLYGLPITIEQTPSGRSVVVPGKKLRLENFTCQLMKRRTLLLSPGWARAEKRQ